MIGGDTPATAFVGTFDGGRHVISNLQVNSSLSYTGFFRRTVGDAKHINIRPEGVSLQGNNFEQYIEGHQLLWEVE